MSHYPSVEEIMCTPKRKQLLQLRRSFRSSLGLILLAVTLSVGISIFAIATYPQSGESSGVWFFTVRLLMLLPIGIILEIVRRYYNDLYILGRDRITHYKGRISFYYSTPSIKCLDLRAIGVNQGLLGRIFDFGDVSLATAGHEGPELTLSGIRAPDELALIIEELRQKSQEDTEDRIGEQLATIRALNDD